MNRSDFSTTEGLKMRKQVLILIPFAISLMSTITLVADDMIPDAIRVRRIGEIPPIGERTQAEVGEVIYSNFDYWEYEITLLDQTFHEKSTLATWNVPSDTRLVAVSDNRAFPRLRPVKFCTIEGYLHVAGMGKKLRVCFRDTTGDSQMDQYSAIDSPPAWRKWRNIKGEKPEIRPIEHGAIDVGFKRELSYSGRAGDIISLSYREYTEEGLARPAFTQDVSYTLAHGGETTIGFRGARILVHNATNNRIVFTIEQGFKE